MHRHEKTDDIILPEEMPRTKATEFEDGTCSLLDERCSCKTWAEG